MRRNCQDKVRRCKDYKSGNDLINIRSRLEVNCKNQWRILEVTITDIVSKAVL
jgi:hypothetical protein